VLGRCLLPCESGGGGEAHIESELFRRGVLRCRGQPRGIEPGCAERREHAVDQQRGDWVIAFGKLARKGEDVLLKIGETAVSPSPSGEMSVPQTRIEIKSVKIVPADSIK